MHTAQVREKYASEDGLNLRALDADSVALGRAAAALQEAAVRGDKQLAAAAVAWQGGGADASLEFLRRHSDAASKATAAVQSAAETLTTLRDELWRLIDAKVAAAMSIDERTQAQRAEWLAAAQTVMSGTGDRSAASELIGNQVKPFVDNTIRGELLTGFRSTEDSIGDAYDAATTTLTGEPGAVFDVPGDVGPSWMPTIRDDGAATVPAAASAPASVVSASPSWGAPPSWAAPPTWGEPQPWGAPAATAPMPVAPAAADPLPAPAAAPAAAMPSTPSLGGMPDVGGGLSGFGQQLADMLGGLIGSSDNAGLPDPSDLGDPTQLDDPPAPDDPEPDQKPDDEPADDAADAEDPTATDERQIPRKSAPRTGRARTRQPNRCHQSRRLSLWPKPLTPCRLRCLSRRPRRPRLPCRRGHRHRQPTPRAHRARSRLPSCRRWASDGVASVA